MKHLWTASLEGLDGFRCVRLYVLIPNLYKSGWNFAYSAKAEMGKILKIWWNASWKGLDGLFLPGLICWFKKYIYVWVKYCVKGEILKWRKNDNLVNCLFKWSRWSKCVGLDELIPKIYICQGEILQTKWKSNGQNT